MILNFNVADDTDELKKNPKGLLLVVQGGLANRGEIFGQNLSRITMNNEIFE